MSPDTQHGHFVWTELLTRDVAAATGFYGAVFGWTTVPFPGSDPPYSMWANEGRPFGGIQPLPAGAGAPPSWLPYVGVLDVDAAVIRAQEEGGRVQLEPTEIPGAGRFAVLADPAGASFAVYRSVAPQPEPGMPAVGEFSWREVATSDIDRVVGFYGEMFGWARGATHDLGTLGPYVLLEQHGRPLAGVYLAGESMPPAWTSYVRVADLDAVRRRVVDAGGRELQGPTEVPGGDTIAVCADREGAVIALHHVAG